MEKGYYNLSDYRHADSQAMTGLIDYGIFFVGLKLAKATFKNE